MSTRPSAIVFSRTATAVCILAAASLFLRIPGASAADTPARLEQARVHFQKGRLDEALELYDSLAADETALARVAIGKSRCLEARGDWSGATDILVAAAGKAESDTALATRLAEIYLMQGRFDDARRVVTRALEIDANLPAARLVAADLQAATGDLKRADEGYHWFVKFYNNSQPEDSEVLLLVARGASQYARWHSVPQIFNFAVNTLCTDALAKDKNCWESHFIAGMLLLEKFNRAQAVPELKLALAINPQAAEVHAALAAAALQDRALAEAGEHLNRALAINPRLPLALRIRADLSLEEEDLPAAIKFLERVLEVNPHDEQALGRLAACRILEDGPPSPAELDELFAKLEALAKLDQPQSGTRFGDLLAATVGWNAHPGVFLFSAAEELESRKQFAIAERLYRQAIEAMPQLSGPKSALGMLYMRTGQIDDARKLLDQAFEADPYHVRVSNMRKVVKLLDGYHSITTDHFVIRVDSQADLVLGQYVAEFLEGEYPALVAQFGYAPPSRTQFEIYHKSKGLSAHQWFSARMVGLPWVQTIGASTGMIVALASPTATEKPFNWARVVKHEFVHILTLQQTNFNIPHWYTEALAVLSEESPRPELWNQLLLDRVPRGEILNLDTLNQGFTRPRSPLDWQMAYCQSRLYAEYMIEKFGPQTTRALLEAYRDHLTTEQAIKKVFGIDKAAFEQGYRDYLETIVADLRGHKLEESMTPAAAEKAYREKPTDAHAAGRYARELSKQGKFSQARKIALAALEIKKGEPLAAVVMAGLELRGEDVDAAIGCLVPALDEKDPHPDVLELLAQLRFKQDDFSESARLYELGLEHDPDRVAWLKGLAAAHLKALEFENARPVLERLVVADGDNAGPRKRLARMALDDDDFAGAVRFARLALHVDVADVETHKILAAGYAGLKEFARAADEWSVALKLKPDAPDVEVELARAEAGAGNVEAALKRLNDLLDRDPQNDRAIKLRSELK